MARFAYFSGRPTFRARGIKGSRSAHSSSRKSLGYVFRPVGITIHSVDQNPIRHAILNFARAFSTHSKEAQGRRLRTLRAEPATAWRVTDEDWHHHRIYDRLAKTAEFIRAKTNRLGAYW